MNTTVPARRAQRRQERPQRVERPVQVGVDHRVPALVGELVQPALRDVRAGGDDQRVHVVELRRERVDRLPVGEVEPVRDHALEADLAPGGGVHAVALAEERARGLQPDPARRPDHDDRAAHASRRGARRGRS